MRKLHVICHMSATIDGRIDPSAANQIATPGDYEKLGSQLGGDAWICGRVTMQKHFADAEPFVPTENSPSAGPQAPYVATRAKSYAIAVDTKGSLRWNKSDFDGDHLVCVLSEQTTKAYLDYLRDRGISYLVCGKNSVDLPAALDLLGEHFGIQTLLLEGGGHINGSMLRAGLVDEISLILQPGIDGRSGIATLFDGISADSKEQDDFRAVPLKLKSVEQQSNDALWIRYQVIKPAQS
ncbi:RibD family protein [Granulicella sp. dw_53]|uniref:RibD family protein n=1 Tax=Granulicella sp. dw_53 TaxID=2719792 RepID=UPI001BD3D9F2|nr:RibD family protein [Granulicella sp. dw_53]